MLKPSKYCLLETHCLQANNLIVYVSVTEILKLYQSVPKNHLFSFETIRPGLLSPSRELQNLQRASVMNSDCCSQGLAVSLISPNSNWRQGHSVRLQQLCSAHDVHSASRLNCCWLRYLERYSYRKHLLQGQMDRRVTWGHFSTPWIYGRVPTFLDLGYALEPWTMTRAGAV